MHQSLRVGQAPDDRHDDKGGDRKAQCGVTISPAFYKKHRK